MASIDNDWNSLQFSEIESVESEPDFVFVSETKSKLYKQSFCDSWLQEEQFSGWLEKVKNKPYEAKCNVCNKLIRAKRHNLKMHRNTKDHKIRANEIKIVVSPSSSNDKVFNNKWLEEEEFKGWLQKCNDIFKAKCKFCCRFIKPKRHNLISHSNSETHKNNVLIHTEESIEKEEEENELEEMASVYLDEHQSESSISSSDELDESSSSSIQPEKSCKSNLSEHFRKEWLKCPKYKDWLQEDKANPERCICKTCKKTLGAKKSILESHLLSKNHKQSLPRKPSGKKYVQSFRDEWLQLKQFKNWLQRIDKDPTAAFCSVCNMRLRAKKFNLEDHCRRAHHKRMIEHLDFEILPSYSKGDSISKYFFNQDWLKDENFSGWLKNDENEPGMVICTICKKQLTATKNNLIVHAKSRTHIWRVEQESNLKGFFTNFTGS